MSGGGWQIDFKECFKLIMRICAVPVRVLAWAASLSAKDRERIVLFACCSFLALILVVWILLMIF